VSKLRVHSFSISIDGFGLLGDIDLPSLGYECAEHVAGDRAAAHVFLRRRA
jgi:hypothetical protein